MFFLHIMKTGGTSLLAAATSGIAADATYPSALSETPQPMQKVVVDQFLALPDNHVARLELISMHCPAWVTETLAADRLTVSVLREPVARTVSHLDHLRRLPDTPATIDEIYDDPGWRSRLVDYQTQIFAISRADHEAHQANIHEGHSSDTFAGDPEVVVALRRFLSTGIEVPKAIDEAEYEEALGRLAAITIVGTTDNLSSVHAALERLRGASIPPLEVANRAEGQVKVSKSLRRQIEADTRWDQRLYEVAVRRAARAEP